MRTGTMVKMNENWQETMFTKPHKKKLLIESDTLEFQNATSQTTFKIGAKEKMLIILVLKPNTYQKKTFRFNNFLYIANKFG